MIELYNRLITQGHHITPNRDKEIVRKNFNHDHAARVIAFWEVHRGATQAEINRQINRTSKHCKTIYP